MEDKQVKYTPGPWHNSGYGFIQAGNYNVVGGSNGIKPEDAALIASAPELLEILIELAQAYDSIMGGTYNDPDEAEIIDRANALILKAKGE